MILFSLYSKESIAQNDARPIKVIAFYTAKEDSAHISFVHEANKWFPSKSAANHFTYDSTNNWNNLNAEFLSGYQVVIFLDTRPEDPAQRKAFEEYMKKGGGWLGFHFAGFALNLLFILKTGIGTIMNFWGSDHM